MTSDEKLDAAARSAAILFLPAWAGVVGGELGPPPTALFDVSDKTMHFTAYFILALLATLIFKAGRRALVAVMALIAMGGLLEIIQGMVGRDMDIFDEIANACGAISGGVLGWLFLALLTGRVLVARRQAD